MLARALAKPSNVLVLDEPTNDLDLETLDLLQELLADYPGTVILVSHDRDFLDRVVTSVIAAEGDGRWTEYAGGYSDMLAQRKGEDLTQRQQQQTNQAHAKKTEKAATTAPAAETAKAKGKLSFKDKYALETLPARIDKLTAEAARLQSTLADPNLYAKNPQAFAEATASLAKCQSELSDAEEQWLELEMLRQELEG
jgi:ATP-binding cassette subfamily F protein uup